MFNCRKAKIKEAIPPSKISNDKVIQLVIGHNSKYRGAVNYLGESEYTFNSRIASKLAEVLGDNGYSCVIVKRPPVKSYTTQVNAVEKETITNEPNASIHLHFNSFNKTVLGCEAYITDSNQSDSFKLADTFTDILNIRHGFKERYSDGVRTLKSGHSGYTMVKRISQYCPTILVEPCFANFRTKESKFIFENEDRYVQVLLDTIKAVI